MKATMGMCQTLMLVADDDLLSDLEHLIESKMPTRQGAKQMNKREALKLKPGDLVIAPKLGQRVPYAIVRRLDEDESEGNHPLFEVRGQRGPVTYLLLEKVEVKS